MLNISYSFCSSPCLFCSSPFLFYSSPFLFGLSPFLLDSCLFLLVPPFFLWHFPLFLFAPPPFSVWPHQASVTSRWGSAPGTPGAWPRAIAPPTSPSPWSCRTGDPSTSWRPTEKRSRTWIPADSKSSPFRRLTRGSWSIRAWER